MIPLLCSFPVRQRDSIDCVVIFDFKQVRFVTNDSWGIERHLTGSRLPQPASGNMNERNVLGLSVGIASSLTPDNIQQARKNLGSVTTKIRNMLYDLAF